MNKVGQTIKEIKARLAELTDLSAKEFLEFETDERAGVQAALKSRKKQILAECAEDERLEQMLEFEKELYSQEIELIEQKRICL